MCLLYCCVKRESSGWEQLKRLFSSRLLSGRSRNDWLDFYLPWLWQWRVLLLLTEEKHFCFNAPGFTASSEKWGWRSTRNYTHDLCQSYCWFIINLSVETADYNININIFLITHMLLTDTDCSILCSLYQFLATYVEYDDHCCLLRYSLIRILHSWYDNFIFEKYFAMSIAITRTLLYHILSAAFFSDVLKVELCQYLFYPIR